MKKYVKLLRRVFMALSCLGVAAVVVLFIGYKAVEWSSKRYIYTDVEDIPYHKVGLLLGTNPVGPNGGENVYFLYRIEAAVQLYEAGKISYILVSGDNHTRRYDEPEAMKEALMARGIPEEAIVLDYAGFRTLDSIIRAKAIFGQESMTIVSQRFHNERAVCLARHYGISAVGYNARDVRRRRIANLKYAILRESMARVKMYVDMLVNKQPKFLGERIPIGE